MLTHGSRLSLVVMAAIAVVVGDLALGVTAFWLAVTAGFRPPPADPGLWPIVPQLATLGYGVVLIGVLRWQDRAGVRWPLADGWRWLPLVMVFVGPSLVALLVAGIRPATTWNYLVPQHALSGVGEEIVYRGVVLTLLLPLGRMRAALLTTLLFASTHFFDAAVRFDAGNVGVVYIAFTAGIMLAAIRIRSGSIYPGIVAHVTYNVIADLVGSRGLYPMATITVVWPIIVAAVAIVALRSGREDPTDLSVPAVPALGIR